MVQFHPICTIIKQLQRNSTALSNQDISVNTIVTSPRVLGKLRWATKLFNSNGTIKKQHMHKMSKMFVFFRRKVLIYKNWTWIVFTFCKMKTLIVIFIFWAAHDIYKWFTSFSSNLIKASKMQNEKLLHQTYHAHMALLTLSILELLITANNE